MISAVPVLIPVTRPVVAFTVAFAALLLLHVPPDGPHVSVVADPWQMLSMPATGVVDE